MKKTFAVVAALLTICGSAFAAPPPGHASSHRIHVSPSHRMHTPVRNRVHMTPAHPGGTIGGILSGPSLSSSGHAAPLALQRLLQRPLLEALWRVRCGCVPGRILLSLLRLGLLRRAGRTCQRKAVTFVLSIIVTQQENLKGKIIFAYLQRGLSGSLFLSDKKTASAFLRMPISL